MKVALVAGAVVVGVGVGIGVAVAQGSGGGATPKLGAGLDPGTTFPAGTRRAPDFRLRDQAGRTITMRSLRGRPVVIAFIDPVCHLDAVRWRLAPEWRWALGGYPVLEKVWQQYAIGVQVHTKTLAGVTAHTVDHTEAAYVIDPSGYERTLFLYPYRSGDVVNAVRRVSAGRSSSSQR